MRATLCRVFNFFLDKLELLLFLLYLRILSENIMFYRSIKVFPNW